MSSNEGYQPETALATATRRAVLRGGLVGSAALAAAALIGCATRSSEKPAGAPAGAAGKPKLLNEDLLALNDPNLPYPWVVAEPDTPPKRGGTYRQGWSGDFASFDPIVSTSTTTHNVPQAVGDRLVDWVHGARVNPFKNQIVPGIATSWELSPDGLTYTFKLAPNAKWQNKPPLNGRPFTANDVRLVHERASTAGPLKGVFEGVAGLKAIDAHTYQIRLKRPQPDFLMPLAGRESELYPMEMIDNGALAKSADAIGTGAYILTSVARSSHASFVKNPDYWHHDPYIEKIEIKVMPDAAARLAGMRAGTLDYANPWFVNKRDADTFKASNPEMHIVWLPSPLLGGSVIAHQNMNNPKWQDERVRQAMALGLDRKRFIDLVFQGYGTPFVRTLPWGFLFDKAPTVQAELGPWERYAPDEAKKLLQAAGQERFSFDFSIANTATGAGPDFFTDNLKQIGVTVTQKIADYTVAYAAYQTKKYPDTTFGYIGASTADQWFKDMMKTNGAINFESISDPEIDQWSEQQSAELNPQKRKDILRKIWDRDGQKAYHPMGAVGGLGGSASAWPPYLRNLFLSGTPFISQFLNDNWHYVQYAWLDK